MSNEQTVDPLLEVYVEKQAASFLNWFIDSNWKWYNKDLYIDMFTNETGTAEKVYQEFIKTQA